MKKFAALFTFISVLQLAYSQTRCITVSGTAFIISDYCGGAEPSEEDLKLLNTPKPLPNLKLFVKQGNTNSLKKKFIKIIQTDSLGQFTLELKSGTYCMVGEKKSKPFKYPVQSKTQQVDSLCYKKEFCTCDLVFTVTKQNLNDLKIIFTEHCAWRQPCIEYSDIAALKKFRVQN